MMRHGYDHACRCQDCTSHERALAAQINHRRPRVWLQDRLAHLSRAEWRAHSLRHDPINAMIAAKRDR